MPTVTLKHKISASLGNLLEWYDFALYGYFAEPIGKLFFPQMGGKSLLASFSVFAVGFLSRPLGAILFGYLGDRYGRRPILLIAFFLMFFSTMSIGLLPTYQQVGLLAPCLLIFVRILQGMSVGSQYTGSITYLSEFEGRSRYRSLVLCYPWIFSNLGFILASLVAYVYLLFVNDTVVSGWGWRIPFLTSGFSFIFLLWQRSNLDETPDFKLLQRKQAEISSINPLECIQHFPRSFMTTVAISSGMFVIFYILFVFLISYLPLYHELSSQDAVLINLVALTAQIVFIPFVAYWSDRCGAKQTFYLTSTLFFLCVYPAFRLFELHQFYISLMALTILSLICAGFYTTISVLMVDAFPTKYRLAGTSIGYNTAAALLGGTAPIVSTVLVSWLHDINAPAYYMMFWCLVGILGAIFIPRVP